MLTWTKKEGAINERIPVEDKQLVLAEDALYARPPLRRQRRQNEAPRVIVAVIAFVFRLQANKHKPTCYFLNRTQNKHFKHHHKSSNIRQASTTVESSNKTLKSQRWQFFYFFSSIYV